MSNTVPSYIAIQFKGIDTDSGWLPTGAQLDFNGLPTGGANEPASTTAWGETVETRFSLGRDFEGINSSGGPQSVVRADFADLEVERYSDALTPYLYEYCLTGKQLAWVHLVRVGPDDAAGVAGEKLVHIRLNDVQVVGFETEGVRWFGQQVEPTARHSYVTGTGTTDTIKFLFTRISFESRGIERGWDTGADKPWTSTT